MSDTPSRKIFVNLAVRDLKPSVQFFSVLGFAFDPKFTDDNAEVHRRQRRVHDHRRGGLRHAPLRAVLPDVHAARAVRHDPADRGPVRAVVRQPGGGRRDGEDGLAAGGQPAMDPMDHGFMYGWSFYDPDGHHWEVFWMDPRAAQQEGP